jgi:dTDP-4-dehydrorhamnose reductase
MWAGIECTVNRVGDRYFDQVERTGHGARVDDLDRLAALGVRTVRYPVLWERVAPSGLAHADWTWSDARLARLRVLGMTPIVTLLHHGSGPRHTNLLDPDFGAGFAQFAGAVARRYPWLEWFTPVNEPLTTARFSALYGLWYPHARDDRSFVRAFLNQIRAVRLAMAAVREIIPHAKLLQTEDLGRTHATATLGYQADFENERRWITFDALAGRLDDRHPLWSWLHDAGQISGTEVRDAVGGPLDLPTTPDLLGINHYLTSERWLDERLHLYPPHTHGGNSRHRYADVEAVRVLRRGPSGPRQALADAWERYASPVAMTETQLAATVTQQIAWLTEVWRGASALRDDGGDVRAVTAWSVFGCYDWSSLLTRADGTYEPGAFDVGSLAADAHAPPRRTRLATAIERLAAGDSADEAARQAVGGDLPRGWWTADDRLTYPVADCHARACCARGQGDGLSREPRTRFATVEP